MSYFIDHEQNVCCALCDKPMLGIKNIEARDTCCECGGESLVALSPDERMKARATYRNRRRAS